MNALSKWWEELESDDRMLLIVGAGIWLFIMCLVNPAIPIMVIFFAGMAVTMHITRDEPSRTLEDYKAEMQAEKERRRRP